MNLASTHNHEGYYSPTEFEAMKSLLINQKVDWDTLFRFFGEKDFSLNDLLMGPQFLRAVKDFVRYL